MLAIRRFLSKDASHLILLALPWLLLALNPNWPFGNAYNLDPWLYWTHARTYPTFQVAWQGYYGERLPMILPAYLFHHLFTPIVGASLSPCNLLLCSRFFTLLYHQSYPRSAYCSPHGNPSRLPFFLYRSRRLGLHRRLRHCLLSPRLGFPDALVECPPTPVVADPCGCSGGRLFLYESDLDLVSAFLALLLRDPGHALSRAIGVAEHCRLRALVHLGHRWRDGFLCPDLSSCGGYVLVL